MKTPVRLRRLAIALLLLGTAVAAGADDAPPQPEAARGQPAAAEREVTQPHNNAPVWRDVRSGETRRFTTSQVRGPETKVLIQTEGEVWRRIRNGPITVFGGAMLIFALAVLFAFYLWKGPIKVHGALTGRKIQRLTPWDRAIHWTVALTWLALAISGVVLIFGKYLLLPVFGYALFSALAIVSKNVHNFVGPVFLIAAALMFFTYLGRNIPRAHDIGWLMKGGGMLTGEHVPSGFFNAGEKIVFWVGLTLFSIVVGVSGLVLLFPGYGQTREIMQYANILHGVVALFYIAMIFGHMYLGSIGMEGAYHAMRRDGRVDEQWAKEHHEYWYDEVMAKRRARTPPAVGTSPTAAPVTAPEMAPPVA
ncbi:MAG TPA: formate dehydrogenase subunit gamma [Burkholderiales bacterium]|nr:formate dehydrogenase subunit gamma [Burkholderiales bacterium]